MHVVKDETIVIQFVHWERIIEWHDRTKIKLGEIENVVNHMHLTAYLGTKYLDLPDTADAATVTKEFVRAWITYR